MQPVQRRYRQRRSSVGSYVIPFLILIAIGVIIVLLFRLWGVIFADEDVQGAYVHVVEGSVQTKQWGAEKFVNLSTDVLILEDDELKTSPDSKIIVEFFDGTIMRLAGGSDVVFQKFDSEAKVPMIEVLLVDGQAWFNNFYKGSGAELTVKMNNTVVKSTGSDIFAVDNEFEESVKGIDGTVTVSIYSKDEDSVVDSVDVGVGQQIVFTEEVLRKYWQFQSPSVLTAITDTFKESDWYKWNISEDESPTEFVKIAGDGSGFVQVEPEVLEGDEEVDGAEDKTVGGEEGEKPVADVVAENQAVEKLKEVEEPVSSNVPVPTIISVGGVTEVNEDGFYVTSNYVGTLKGNVTDASKIIVNDYTLSKFKPGDTTWVYHANANYGLMVEGENTFNVYAEDAEGNRSEPLVVKVIYNPPASVPAPTPALEELAPVDDPVSESSTATESTVPDPSEVPEPDWL